MAMKECKYERKKHIIKNLETGESVPYFGQDKKSPSVNQAKKASRGLQGTSGDGTLKVIYS